MVSLIKRLVSLGSSKHAERNALRELFDEEYYVTQYPEVREAGLKPFDHFMMVGWQEGRNPSVHFDVLYYFEKNPDVKATGVNPVLHYLRNGKAEGRQPRPPFEGNPASAPDSCSPEDLTAVRPHFDAAYYLAMHEDVRKSGLDPLGHYMSTGWREYRNPSANFNTATYLQLNKDVREAGINPLLHYANNGRYEDRIIKLSCLEELSVLRHKFRGRDGQEGKISVTIEPIRKLDALLVQSDGKPTIVALSHDDYLANIGGVQVFIREEEEKFREAGYIYVHLSPISTGGVPALGRDYVRVIIDRSAPEIYLFDEVVELLRSRGESSDQTLIIHSLINFDEEYVLDSIVSMDWPRKYHWIHDYSLLCGEFNLLRNGVKWCGFPDKESAACYTCAGYKSRDAKQRMLDLLVTNDFVFVAPSNAARKVLTTSGKVPGNRIRVVNHVDLIDQGSSHVKLRATRSAVRVAYCGHPVFHKGWGVFQQLVEFSVVSGDYRFYHLGVHDTHLNAVEFVHVRNTAESRDAMIKAIRDLEIDIVVVAAQWAETFCYVAYEAILGGALVFTTDVSGNVAALSALTPHVISFPGNHELIEAFTSGRAKEIALAKQEEGLPAYSAEYRGTTAALEVAHEK